MAKIQTIAYAATTYGAEGIRSDGGSWSIGRYCSRAGSGCCANTPAANVAARKKTSRSRIATSDLVRCKVQLVERRAPAFEPSAHGNQQRHQHQEARRTEPERLAHPRSERRDHGIGRMNGSP